MTNNDKNFTKKPEALPVAQKQRPVPYYLQKPQTKWLEQYIKVDVFEEVADGEPVTRCSLPVVQPKPRFCATDKDELQRHMIRGFTYKFHDCSVFSKLDMRQGYQKLQLDTEL